MTKEEQKELDWPDGEYTGKCFYCKKLFQGPKRIPSCRRCYDKEGLADANQLVDKIVTSACRDDVGRLMIITEAQALDFLTSLGYQFKKPGDPRK